MTIHNLAPEPIKRTFTLLIYEHKNGNDSLHKSYEAATEAAVNIAREYAHDWDDQSEDAKRVSDIFNDPGQYPEIFDAWNDYTGGNECFRTQELEVEL